MYISSLIYSLRCGKHFLSKEFHTVQLPPDVVTKVGLISRQIVLFFCGLTTTPKGQFPLILKSCAWATILWWKSCLDLNFSARRFMSPNIRQFTKWTALCKFYAPWNSNPRGVKVAQCCSFCELPDIGWHKTSSRKVEIKTTFSPELSPMHDFSKSVEIDLYEA